MSKVDKQNELISNYCYLNRMSLAASWLAEVPSFTALLAYYFAGTELVFFTKDAHVTIVF